MSTTTASGKTKYKLVFLGNQNVGKSSIIDKYIHNRFEEASNPTVGIDFLAKNTIHKGKTYRLQLWDTAGQERFKSLIPSYLKDAVGAIIVYDVTNKQSLADAEKWLRLYYDNKSLEGYAILVGNKTDLPYREISEEDGKRAAAQLKIQHFQMSAKTGQNVQELFLHIIDCLTDGKSPAHPPKSTQSMMRQIKEERKQDDGQNDITNKGMNNRLQELPSTQTPSGTLSEQPRAPNNIVLSTATESINTRPANQSCC